MDKFFVVNTTTGNIVGLIEELNDVCLSDNELPIGAPDHLVKLMTIPMMTVVYNALTGKNIKLKGGRKVDVAKKVFSFFRFAKSSNLDSRYTVNIFLAINDIIVKQTKAMSKLQLLYHWFNIKNDDGTPKKWAIAELACAINLNEDRVHQYISILKNPKDRFMMKIAKDSNGFYYLAK